VRRPAGKPTTQSVGSPVSSLPQDVFFSKNPSHPFREPFFSYERDFPFPSGIHAPVYSTPLRNHSSLFLRFFSTFQSPIKESHDLPSSLQPPQLVFRDDPSSPLLSILYLAMFHCLHSASPSAARSLAYVLPLALFNFEFDLL